jgi:hypothetical protein
MHAHGVYRGCFCHWITERPKGYVHPVGPQTGYEMLYAQVTEAAHAAEE